MKPQREGDFYFYSSNHVLVILIRLFGQVKSSTDVDLEASRFNKNKQQKQL